MYADDLFDLAGVLARRDCQRGSQAMVLDETLSGKLGWPSNCGPPACAGTSAVADAGGRLAYDDGSPREVTLPRDSPGWNASTFRLGRFKTGEAGGRPPVYPPTPKPNRK